MGQRGRGGARQPEPGAGAAGRCGAVRGGEGRAGSGEREPSERRPGTVSRFHAWLRGVTGEGKAESAAPPWVVSPDAFFFFFLEERTLRRIH